MEKPIVNSRVYFEGEKRPYRVRACNDRFLICTKPHNPLHTVLYSIIDLQDEIRGTENLVFGFGAETDEQCNEMLDRLTKGETEISHRNRVKLEITKIII